LTVYWETHHVPVRYGTLEESQRSLRERALLFPSLLELMPIDFPDKIILDYGCGPGHDTILFCEAGAGHVFYYDTSAPQLEIVDRRLELHGLEMRASPVERGELPLVDHVHCAGVIHHMEDPLSGLKDIRYAMKEDADAAIMVYDGELSLRTQSEVPITHWWTPLEFRYLCRLAGLDAKPVGSYPCSAPWRPDCYAACFQCHPL